MNEVTMDEINTRARLLKKDLTEWLELVEQAKRNLQERNEEMNRLNLTGKKAAELLGYTNERSFYNLVPELKNKGWFSDGYTYSEVIELMNWKARNGNLNNVPNKKAR